MSVTEKTTGISLAVRRSIPFLPMAKISTALRADINRQTPARPIDYFLDYIGVENFRIEPRLEVTATNKTRLVSLWTAY